jgi:alpha-mannosidase
VIELDAPGVRIDALKMADDGSADRILRIHEACGDRRRVSVTAGFPIESARRCNLLEEPDAAAEVVEVVDGRITLWIRPFELITLRLGSP